MPNTVLAQEVENAQLANGLERPKGRPQADHPPPYASQNSWSEFL